MTILPRIRRRLRATPAARRLRAAPAAARRCGPAWPLVLAWLALCPWPAPAQPADPAPDGGAFSVRRFLVAVGNNSGGRERALLRYAVSDAQGVARVFEELGGVDRRDRVLLLEAGPAELRQALTDLRARVEQAARENSRVELVVYYSGHSDETGLLLGGELLTYAELRATVDAISADVRIIVLDSCASGAFTRVKGGRQRPPFLLDASARMKGHAFLTSSSHDEAAQESDRIGGSFFTNALVSGLRGAADVTQDQRVTLNEAYQFAFHTTLARTEGTRSGPQHPGYDIQLVGAGDLVMTDLRTLTAGLVLPEALQGRLHVRDDRDALVVELQKPAGRRVELGLEPGGYRLFLDHEGRYATAAVTLSDNGLTTLSESSFLPMTVEETAARGEFPAPAPALSPGPGTGPTSPADLPAHAEFSASLWPGMSTLRGAEEHTVSDVSLNLTIGRNGGVNGFEAGYVGNWTLGDVEGVQLAGGLNLVEGRVEALQLSTFVNRVNGDVSGVQASGLINSVGGRVDGAQWSSALNVVAGGLKGIQAAALLNVVSGSCEGAQAAGVLNTSHGFLGLQAAGLWNWNRGHGEGLQTAGLASATDSLLGLQLSTINLARVAEGAQIGVVNLGGTVNGAQIGVINIAREVDGAPIGVLNLIERGRHDACAWTSDTGDAMFGIELGNDRVHSLLAGGTQSVGGDRHFAGFGLGLTIPIERRWAGLLDATSYYIFEDRDSTRATSDEDLHLLNVARLGLEWRAAPHLALVGGAALNVFTSRRNDGSDLEEGDPWRREKRGDTWVRVWPGFFLGVRI